MNKGSIIAIAESKTSTTSALVAKGVAEAVLIGTVIGTDTTTGTNLAVLGIASECERRDNEENHAIL